MQMSKFMEMTVKYGIIDCPGWIAPDGAYAHNRQRYTASTHEATAQIILVHEYNLPLNQVVTMTIPEITRVMVGLGFARVDTELTIVPHLVPLPQLATLQELNRNFGYCDNFITLKT